jgi:hypothetical protein
MPLACGLALAPREFKSTRLLVAAQGRAVPAHLSAMRVQRSRWQARSGTPPWCRACNVTASAVAFCGAGTEYQKQYQYCNLMLVVR